MSPTSKPSATVAAMKRGLGAAAKTDTSQDARTAQSETVVPPPRPAKPIRFTLDLDEAHHTFLKGFALECGPGVGGAQVLRALLDELQEGPNLAARIKARIWEARK